MRPRTWPAAPSRAPAAAAGLAAALGACLWMVAAAAERPSVLSPPSLRAHAPLPWLLGPLHGAAAAPDDRRRTRCAPTSTSRSSCSSPRWLLAWACRAGAAGARVVAAAVAAAQVVFVLGPPQPLTDVFNYVVYGRMAAHGLNPYAHAAGRRGRTTSPTRSRTGTTCPAPTARCSRCSPSRSALLPLPVASGPGRRSSALCALATARAGRGGWPRRLGRSPQRAIVFAGLCPVTLAVGIGGFHNDLPAVLCVVAAAARACCAARDDERRRAGAGTPPPARSPSLAAGLKPPFAIVVPLVVLGAHRRRPRRSPARPRPAPRSSGSSRCSPSAARCPSLGAQGALVTPLSVPEPARAGAPATGAPTPPSAPRAATRSSSLVAVAAAAVVAGAGAGRCRAIGALLLAQRPDAVVGDALVPRVGAAVRRRRRGRACWRPLAVVVCLWLGVGGCPQLPELHPRARLLPDAHGDRAWPTTLRAAAGPMSAEAHAPGRASAPVGVLNTLLTLAAFAALTRLGLPGAAASALGLRGRAPSTATCSTRRWTFRGAAGGPSTAGALRRRAGARRRAERRGRRAVRATSRCAHLAAEVVVIRA